MLKLTALHKYVVHFFRNGLTRQSCFSKGLFEIQIAIFSSASGSCHAKIANIGKITHWTPS